MTDGVGSGDTRGTTLIDAVCVREEVGLDLEHYRYRPSLNHCSLQLFFIKCIDSFISMSSYYLNTIHSIGEKTLISLGRCIRILLLSGKSTLIYEELVNVTS